MSTLAINVQTPETLTTTYKTWFDSWGVLNEWELKWEKWKKEEKKCEKKNKEWTERFWHKS